MKHSSKLAPVVKPRPDFPLFPHRAGYWAKKVRGKLLYFGKTADDPKGEAALIRWLDDKDDRLAGRTPRAKGDGLTMADLCNRFLSAKQERLNAGEITNRTWLDYKMTTDRLIHDFGKGRLVSDLRSEDFEKLRAGIAKTRGHVAVGNEIQRVRTVFKYGYEAGLMEHQQRFGPMFKRPSRKTLRVARAKQGPKLFSSVEIGRLLSAANPQMQAMILLGINCGFGPSECATLPMQAIDLETGWIHYPRPKTGVDRRCPLWPQTIAALGAVLARRKPPKDAENSERLFVTKAGGTFYKTGFDSPISKEFAKLLKEMGLARTGRAFYAIRHTFRTIADETRDQPACDHIMGHARSDMASVYRERIEDDRLRAVVDHVQGWIFPKA